MSNDATGIGQTFIVTSSPTELAEVNISGSLSDTATRLKSIRDAAGFSQRELAKRAGVTNSSISMIEQGQVSPSIQSLARILAAFPISLADFFSFNFLAEVRPHSTVDFVVQSLINVRQLDTQTEHLLAGQSTPFSALAVDSCGVVLNGKLQLTLLSGSHLLSEGDNFYIPANQLFRLINLSGQDASLFRCSLFVHKG